MRKNYRGEGINDEPILLPTNPLTTSSNHWSLHGSIAMEQPTSSVSTTRHGADLRYPLPPHRRPLLPAALPLAAAAARRR
jgi:hypothetical protein